VSAQLKESNYFDTYVVLQKVEVVEANGPAKKDGDAPKEEDPLKPLLLLMGPQLVDEVFAHYHVAVEQSFAIF
jgi:hypothetical protein